MTAASPDPVVVGLVANRLYSMLEEQQTALIRTAFSSVVRESMDLACAVFDSNGQMIGQSTGGTPGHINAMATGMAHIVESDVATHLSDGDVLLTNDPWMTAGQINDLTVATPVFRDGRIVAWFASCCHSPDIGGRILSASATEVYEEGLRIPILKLVRAGQVDPVVESIIRANVRTPDETMGDLHAQMSGNDVGARSLLRLLNEFDLDDIDTIAAQVMDRSDRALREALEKTRDGTYAATALTDGFGDEPLTLQVTITIDGDSVAIDYTGSSPQSPHGVNVVLNYTRAYTSFAIKAALAPQVPHNAGSFRPMTISAPAGSVLNCIDPAPVASRHLVGHFLPSLLFDALRPALDGTLPAASADALWMTVWRSGGPDEQEPFTLTTFGAGGSGARPNKNGLTTTGFPTGVRAAPTEVVETLTPLIQDCRAIRTDSGGAGRWRGGLGQLLRVRRRGDDAWTLNANIDRVDHAAPGAYGGHAGATGAFADDTTTEALPRKRLVRLEPDSRVRLEFPGGGGYADPRTRPVAEVLDDVLNGYVSLAAARDTYGVAIDYRGAPDALVRPPSVYQVDESATRALRDSSATGHNGHHGS